MKAEGLNNSKFASILGIQRSNITHIIDGRNKPSLSFIEKLITKFPRINVEWLITGNGEMYKQNKTPEQKSVQKRNDSPTLFPVVTNVTSEDKPAIQVEKETAKIPEINVPPPPPQYTEETKVQNSKQQTPPKPDSTENIAEEEIECVLIFHSDKTFQYYKPK
jgi:plasmid maintenance system antidote protein VapI